MVSGEGPTLFFHVAIQLPSMSKEHLSSAVLLCSQSLQPLAGLWKEFLGFNLVL